MDRMYFLKRIFLGWMIDLGGRSKILETILGHQPVVGPTFYKTDEPSFVLLCFHFKNNGVSGECQTGTLRKRGGWKIPFQQADLPPWERVLHFYSILRREGDSYESKEFGNCGSCSRDGVNGMLFDSERPPDNSSGDRTVLHDPNRLYRSR
jgi:hypothetical protein